MMPRQRCRAALRKRTRKRARKSTCLGVCGGGRRRGWRRGARGAGGAAAVVCKRAGAPQRRAHADRRGARRVLRDQLRAVQAAGAQRQQQRGAQQRRGHSRKRNQRRPRAAPTLAAAAHVSRVPRQRTPASAHARTRTHATSAREGRTWRAAACSSQRQQRRRRRMRERESVSDHAAARGDAAARRVALRALRCGAAARMALAGVRARRARCTCNRGGSG
jgi:hypothetical protein